MLIAELEARACTGQSEALARGVAVDADRRAKRHELRVVCRRTPGGAPRLRYYLDGVRMDRQTLATLLCTRCSCPRHAAALARWRESTGRRVRPARVARPDPRGRPLIDEVPVEVEGLRCVARPAVFVCTTPCPTGAHAPEQMRRSGWDLFEDGVWIAGGLRRDRETGLSEPFFTTVEDAVHWLRLQVQRGRRLLDGIR